jgi:hypothetical protein
MTHPIFVGAFILAALLFIGMSGILWYHWKRFAMNDPFVPFMQILYFLGSAILFFISLSIIL